MTREQILTSVHLHDEIAHRLKNLPPKEALLAARLIRAATRRWRHGKGRRPATERDVRLALQAIGEKEVET